jgi:hypothetical protein
MATPMSAVEHDVDAYALVHSDAVTLGEDSSAEVVEGDVVQVESAN